MNYYEVWNKAYGVTEKNVNAVGTFYARQRSLANGAMWAKYRSASFSARKTERATAGDERNPWREAPVIHGMEIRPASIESLQKRGATFIHGAQRARNLSRGLLARLAGLEADAVYGRSSRRTFFRV